MDQSLEARASVPDNPLDIEQIRLKPQNRWLSRPQICWIVQNHEKFHITSAPHVKPPSGSLFLFNREKQRCFRNDRHNWTKQKEGHQKFKVESFGNLDCYYARGEENRNFLRRCYWMRERDFSHIVLVHYLEETGKSGDSSCDKEAPVAGPYSQGQENVEIMPNFHVDSSLCPGSHPNNCRALLVSEYTDTALLPNGAQAFERENSQSEYNHQASSEFDFGPELQQPAVEQIDAGDSFHESLSTIPGIESDPTQLDMGNSDMDAELAQLTDDLWWTSLDFTILDDKWESPTPRGVSIDNGSLSSSSCPDIVAKFDSNNVVKRPDFGGHLQIQEKSEVSAEDSSSFFMWAIDQLNSESAYDVTSKFHDQEASHLELMDSVDPQQKSQDLRNNNSKENHFQRPLSNEKHGYVLLPDSDGDSKFEGKSIYSSSIRQQLFDGLLTEQSSKKRSSSGDNGETGDNENENDVPSIPSEGKLDIQDINAAENFSDTVKANLLLRFDTILCSGSSATNSVTSGLEYASQLSSKINSLLKGENNELDQMLKTGSGAEFSSEKLKDQLLQKHQKEKLREWILQKDAEGGEGPSILDEGGQGVLHLAAALGYDWALKPTVDAGVSVDLRDVNGWTALHWAAFCGRENTVASLISLDADPGALTEPSPKYPLGRTPADLASANGHERIAVYLGKRRLGVPISSINLDNQDDVGRGPKAVPNISEISAVPLSLGNASDCQSRKDLLATTSSITTSEIRPGLFEAMNRSSAPHRSKEMNRLFRRLREAAMDLAILHLVAPPRSEAMLIEHLRKGAMNLAILHLVALPRSEAMLIENLRKAMLIEHLRKGAMNVAILHLVALPRSEDTSHLIAHLQEIKRLWRRIDRLHWRDVWPEDWGVEEEKEERKKRAPDPDLESGKAHKILKGPEDDEGPEKEKEEGKKQAPDLALESGKAYKILKAHLAYKALLITYYNVQSMKTIQMLVLALVEAFKKIGERKLSHIDGRLELSAIRI